jgi:cytoskeletal protein CcmA (bactofilin family)
MVGIKSKNISIIDQEATVEGTFSCKGRLVIKGSVKGTLLGDTVIIAKEGAVYADTRAVSITIGGIFVGEIKDADELIILSTGNCSGKVICKDLVVEAGGILNAEITCNKIHDSKKSSENLPLSQPGQTGNPKHKIQN